MDGGFRWGRYGLEIAMIFLLTLSKIRMETLISIKFNCNNNWNYFKKENWNRVEAEDIWTEIEVKLKLFPEVKYHWCLLCRDTVAAFKECNIRYHFQRKQGGFGSTFKQKNNC